VAVGQALPDGADALLPEDAVLVAEGVAEAQESAFPGLWARRRGEDAPADAMLRQAGEVLRGFDLAVAGAAGISVCEIRRPRILWVGTDSAAGRLVTALACSAGTADADSIDDADVVFVIGDVAAHFERYLGQRARVLARRLALRPGEDGAALRLDDVPILLAPNRVADALGLWLGLGLPIVRALTGASAHRREERSLSRKISSTIGVAELALLRATRRGFDPLAVGDLPLAAIAGADAWAMVPPESEGLAAGEAIEAELLGS
jgi:molybdopterin biosynthesis enzyme